MTGILNPRSFEAIGDAIGDRFSFRELDVIIYKCMSDRIINQLTSDQLPRRVIAKACLQRMESLGATKIFLFLVLNSRKSDKTFCAMLIEACPELRSPGETLKAQIDAVVSTLKQKGDVIKNQIEAGSTSFETVRKIDRSVRRLDIYKTLHDCLHQLQVRGLHGLADDAKHLEDARRMERLRDFQDIVKRCPAAARDRAVLLEPEAQGIESAWIETLANAVGELQEKLDNPDPAKVRFSLQVIFRIIAQDLPRLNRQIFAAARELPLVELADFLSEVSGVVGDAAMASAAAFLHDIRAGLTADVAEHDLWQIADTGLWALDNQFSKSPGDLLEDFALDWPETRALIEALAKGNEGATWARNVLRYSAEVSDGLVRLEAMLSAGEAAADATAAVAALSQSYRNFSQEARIHFFQVDQDLRRKCAALVDIGSPLQTIVEGVHDGR